ncbi:hypothetical protein [Pseudanabaena sp. FACHB-2040]|uniref:hypothetical protein n=1 Tax=Pseudanabaena sp. FACHB-2040 TaxID=2692859 RepID=UPI001683F034|nr:hypothetical protein [Pseudanabaena sp. FACHB-2040]
MRKQVIWAFCCLLVSTFPQKSIAEETPSACSKCEAALEEQQSSLALDYDAFDQTPTQGWRRLADMECYRQAAELIVSYLNTNGNFRGNEHEILSFHAGQMYAYDGDYESAIPFFEQSFSSHEGIPPEFQPYIDAWNIYVNATISFLMQDQAALLACRDELAEGPTLDDGEVMNLNVVDRLIQNFGEPYSQAYSGTEE